MAPALLELVIGGTASKIDALQNNRVSFAFVGRQMTTLAPAEYKTQADLARMYRRSLNELPVPAGPWAKTYAERNAKYNRQLAASVVFAIITTIAVCSSHVVPRCVLCVDNY